MPPSVRNELLRPCLEGREHGFIGTVQGEMTLKQGRNVVLNLVGCEGLVHPVAKHSDTGVRSRGGGGTSAAAPGHDSHQGPDVILLTHQRTTRVTLQERI